MKKIFVSTILLSLLSGFAASGKPLDLTQVSDDANWLMHVDFEAARNSVIGSFILEELEAKPEALERLTAMTAQFGVDPMAFGNLTMFGNGERKKGIAIMRGGLDADKLVAFARKNESLETTQAGRHQIHSLNQDKRHPVAFAALKNNVVIGGPNAGYVSQGIKLVKGKGASRAAIGLLGKLHGIIDKPGFISFVDISEASKFHELGKHKHGAAMIKMAQSAGMAIGQAAGELKIVAIVETNDEETATQLENMARGMMAMAALGKQSNPRIAEILESHKVNRNGNTVTVQVGLAIETIKEAIEREMEKNI